MSDKEYKIISQNDDIILKKKENKYKLEFETKIKYYDKFINLVKEQKIYEIIYLLNKDIIESYKINIKNDKESDVLYLFSVIEDDDFEEYDKYFFKFDNKMEFTEDSKNFIGIFRGKINDYKYKDYVKINIDDLKMKIIINKEKLTINIILSFKFIDKKINSYIEKIVSMFFKKILHRLKKFLSD